MRSTVLLDDVGYSLVLQYDEAWQVAANVLCGNRNLVKESGELFNHREIDSVNQSLRSHCRDLELTEGDLPATYGNLCYFPRGHWRVMGDPFHWYFQKWFGLKRDLFALHTQYRDFFRTLQDREEALHA